MTFGSKTIVSLTYDGTHISHIETVIPHLDSQSMKGTFYSDPAQMLDHYPLLKESSVGGHEIGNGALLNSALPDGSLPAWTCDMIADDVSEAGDLIDELFPGQEAHSLGLPSGRRVCSDSIDYLAVLTELYPVVRGGEPGLNHPNDSCLGNLRSVRAAGMDGGQMMESVRMAIKGQAWLVFSFDGVGSGDNAIDRSAHQELVAFLADNSDLVAILPVIRAAAHLCTKADSGVSLR